MSLRITHPLAHFFFDSHEIFWIFYQLLRVFRRKKVYMDIAEKHSVLELWLLKLWYRHPKWQKHIFAHNFLISQLFWDFFFSFDSSRQDKSNELLLSLKFFEIKFLGQNNQFLRFEILQYFCHNFIITWPCAHGKLFSNFHCVLNSWEFFQIFTFSQFFAENS